MLLFDTAQGATVAFPIGTNAGENTFLIYFFQFHAGISTEVASEY